MKLLENGLVELTANEAQLAYLRVLTETQPDSEAIARRPE